MKIKDNPQIIVLLPVVGGIALIASGIATGNSALLFAGIGVLFGGSFLCAVIMVICIMLGNKKPDAPSDEAKHDGTDDVLAEARRRAAEKNGTSAETQAALDKIADSAQKRKRAEKRAKTFVILFIVSFVLVAMVGIGLMNAGLMLAGGITFGCAPLMIVSLIVGAKIKERISNAERRRSEQNYDRKVGRVTQCKADGNGTQTIYKVYFLVNNHPYSAISKVPYNDGDKVEVSIMRNGRDALIIGPAEYSFVRGGGNNSVKVKNDEPYVDYAKNKPAEKITANTDITESREEKEQMGAVLGSIWDLREAAKITDEDKQREARKAARKAMFEEFEKLNAIRAQKEKSKNESERTAEAERSEAPAEEPETPQVSALASPDVAPKEQTVKTEAPTEERNDRTSPAPKRATVAYKGINRKK